jgi:hypothetical protein
MQQLKWIDVMQIDEWAYNVCGPEQGRLTLTRVKLTLFTSVRRGADCDPREQRKK